MFKRASAMIIKKLAEIDSITALKLIRGVKKVADPVRVLWQCKCGKWHGVNTFTCRYCLCGQGNCKKEIKSFDVS